MGIILYFCWPNVLTFLDLNLNYLTAFPSTSPLLWSFKFQKILTSRVLASPHHQFLPVPVLIATTYKNCFRAPSLETEIEILLSLNCPSVHLRMEALFPLMSPS